MHRDIHNAAKRARPRIVDAVESFVRNWSGPFVSAIVPPLHVATPREPYNYTTGTSSWLCIVVIARLAANFGTASGVQCARCRSSRAVLSVVEARQIGILREKPADAEGEETTGTSPEPKLWPPPTQPTATTTRHPLILDARRGF